MCLNEREREREREMCLNGGGGGGGGWSSERPGLDHSVRITYI